MTTLLQFPIYFSPLKKHQKPITYHSLPSSKLAFLKKDSFKSRSYKERWSLLGGGKDGIWIKEEGLKRKRRVVLVRFNQGFGGGGGGGGGGGRDNSGTARLLGNIALAVGLTYLSVSGQLGWVFDTVGWILDTLISIWLLPHSIMFELDQFVQWDPLIDDVYVQLLAVVIPIVGLGAFLWWAGRDILQGTCPNCGNEFQIFKSTLNDELQLCPFCSQPFSVVGDEFVSDSVGFSKESTPFGQGFSDFSSGFKKGKESSSAVVDVEAEVKDAD
ncbi:hypothetical protein DKX38_025806 [Salix brachista]|uniref:Uncharacterized protein n=1 Tax=Salix brachista TaxID=2182728 RepID=A0A5N5K2Q6_9ROSI|nr:hypothetical protein DKX38_025806 [Salix brachista]